MAIAIGRRRLAGRLAALAAVALLVTACSGASGGGVTIKDAWARTSPMVAGAGAAYMVIANPGSAADAVVGGSADFAKAVEVHETVVLASASPMASPSTGGGMASPTASGMASGGMVTMQKIDRLEIPAAGSVELKPGGYHIMLIGLARELTAGETVEFTLKFEKAGDVKVKAEVRAK